MNEYVGTLLPATKGKRQGAVNTLKVRFFELRRKAESCRRTGRYRA
jgi:hypothetical protein